MSAEGERMYDFILVYLARGLHIFYTVGRDPPTSSHKKYTGSFRLTEITKV